MRVGVILCIINIQAYSKFIKTCIYSLSGFYVISSLFLCYFLPYEQHQDQSLTTWKKTFWLHSLGISLVNLQFLCKYASIWHQLLYHSISVVNCIIKTSKDLGTLIIHPLSLFKNITFAIPTWWIPTEEQTQHTSQSSISQTQHTRRQRSISHTQHTSQRSISQTQHTSQRSISQTIRHPFEAASGLEVDRKRRLANWPYFLLRRAFEWTAEHMYYDF